jgi:hypothetical protein
VRGPRPLHRQPPQDQGQVRLWQAQGQARLRLCEAQVLGQEDEQGGAQEEVHQEYQGSKVCLPRLP